MLLAEAKSLFSMQPARFLSNPKASAHYLWLLIKQGAQGLQPLTLAELVAEVQKLSKPSRKKKR
jgi:hypothetical protein